MKKQIFNLSKIKGIFPLPLRERVRVRGKKLAFTLAEVDRVPSPRGRARVGADYTPSEQSVSPSLKFVSSPQLANKFFSLPRRDRHIAFTLAEVLITLGVIGVVAAMTLPTVIKNYQKKVASTRVKSAYSQLLQAVQRSEVDNDEIKGWDFSKTDTNFMKKYLEPYFKGMTLCTNLEKCPTGITSTNTDRRYFLSNGTQIDFTIYHNNTVMILIDIDGPKGKNTMGYDWFYFNYNRDLNRIMPYGWFEGITKDDIINGKNDAPRCTMDKSLDYYRHGCTALLMLLGWEMTNEYPW